MAVRLRRAEQVERNREAVLQAAQRVFIERGYAGASLEAIADEAGFSKGVAYSPFACAASTPGASSSPTWPGRWLRWVAARRADLLWRPA